MREVTRDEFFQSIGPQDAIPTPVKRPDTGEYESIWRHRNGALLGRSEPQPGYPKTIKYFLNKESE